MVISTLNGWREAVILLARQSTVKEVTRGWGHFHFSESLFNQMVQFLRQRRHKYAVGYKFGNGPNWRIRVIRQTVQKLGFDQNILKHGVQREVYIIPLAKNWKTYLTGESKRALFDLRTVEEISTFCLNRWIIPRAERDKSFLSVKRDDLVDFLAEQIDL